MKNAFTSPSKNNVRILTKRNLVKEYETLNCLKTLIKGGFITVTRREVNEWILLKSTLEQRWIFKIRSD